MVIEVKQDGKFVKIPFISTNYPVGEAPEDGKQYARKDGDWSEVIIPEVDLTEIETNIAANTAAIDTKVDKVDGKQLSTEDYTTADKTKVANLPTPDSIVVTTDPRLTAATTTKAGLMSAADKVQLDSTLTATEIENKVNAAVSSVYRVKGTVASVSNLPASDVAIGDVWNIEDNGANYVATNNNPVEWDKLSETVDLTPYMQTSTANSTFVKKTGDTMTGDLIIKSSKAATVNGSDSINVYRNSNPSHVNSLRYNGLNINSELGDIPNGLFYVNQAGTSSTGGIGAKKTSDDAKDFLAYITWGSNLGLPANSLLVGVDTFKYKNIDVALIDDSKAITIHANPGSNNKAFFASNGITIIPTSSNNATGLIWKNQANTSTLLQLGAFTNGDSETNYCFMGWGTSPWTATNNLSVGADRFTYKNEKIWCAGNDGAGSGLDADTVDGIQSERIIYGGNASGSTNFGEDLTSFNNNTKSGFYRCNANPKLKLLVSIHHPDSPSDYILQIGTTYEQVLTKNSLNYRIKTRDGGWSEPRTVVDTSTVLTQAEYNALGSTVNSDGKIYFIKE